MSTLFISDLHLAPERPDVTQAFYNFLEHEASKADALYILGDLFEAWIGDDDPSVLPREVVMKLKMLTDRGVPVYFQHGNRDFLVGKRFARETGCQLLTEHHKIDLYGQPILLLHGDTLCTQDVDYQKFRRKVRKPLVSWLLTKLPLKKRLSIAAGWRNKSMQANSNKPSNIMDVTPGMVDQLMSQYGVATMVHGHTHRPMRHQVNRGERIVLGDWESTGWKLTATPDGALFLEEFPIK